MSAQEERDFFWKCFDAYVDSKGNEFFTTHIKNGVNQAAGNINNSSAMAMQTLCCEYKYLEQVVIVQVYINQNERLFDYLYSKKEAIQRELGYEVEWVKSGKISSSVRRIQKKFPINKPIYKMIEQIYPYILDFIKVFEKYL